MLGGRVGIVSIDPVYLPWHDEQIRRYGLESRVVDVRYMRITPDQAVAAYDDPAAYRAIRAMFVDAAESMVRDNRVDVVMSAGGLFALLSVGDLDLHVEGALIANPTYLAVKQAEMALSIAKLNGTPVSRGGTYSRASQQAVNELLALAGKES
jgi:Asp/Glu/hydantoin racemase